VELVDDDRVDVGVDALAQGHVREDLGGAADHGRVAVHGRIARHQADVLRAELVAQREELLGHQRLDGRRVVGATAVREGLEVERERDERLPRPRGGVEDHVLAGEEGEDRLLLRRVEREALVGRVVHEALEQDLGGRVGTGRESVEQAHARTLARGSGLWADPSQRRPDRASARGVLFRT
jgi:hypothetical protein